MIVTVGVQDVGGVNIRLLEETLREALMEVGLDEMSEVIVTLTPCQSPLVAFAGHPASMDLEVLRATAREHVLDAIALAPTPKRTR